MDTFYKIADKLDDITYRHEQRPRTWTRAGAAALVLTGFIWGNALGNTLGLKSIEDGKPAPIEAIAVKNASDLEDVPKDSVVYNETNDTYLVYVEDSDNRAHDAGWYEVGPNVESDQENNS